MLGDDYEEYAIWDDGITSSNVVNRLFGKLYDFNL